MLLLAVFGIALYLPWIPLLIGQFRRVSDNFWIAPLSIGYIFLYVYTVFSTGNYFVSLFLCFMSAFVIISFFTRKNKTEKHIFFFGGFCCAVLLVLTGIVISIAIRPLFVARYLVPMCGLVWLFFAIEYSMINKRRVVAFIYVVLVIIGIMSLSLSAYDEIRENRDSNVFYTYFTERVQQDDVFVFIPPSDTGSLHMVRIMNYLFPYNNYAIIYSGQKFEENIFHDRTIWIFIMEEERSNIQVNYDIQKAKNVELSGSFIWNSSYRFRLYKRLPYN
jgi:hypothetical protein